jgi:hypothetical protein
MLARSICYSSRFGKERRMTDDGGPAFPTHNEFKYQDGGGVLPIFTGGLSLRDWFAGQALMGYVAGCRLPMPGSEVQSWDLAAAWAFAAADAMLAKRKKADEAPD